MGYQRGRDWWEEFTFLTQWGSEWDNGQGKTNLLLLTAVGISSGGIQGAGGASEVVLCRRSFPSVIPGVSEGQGSAHKKPLCAQPSRWLRLSSLLGSSEGFFFTMTCSKVQGVLSKVLQQSFVSFLERTPGVGNNKTLFCLTYFLPPSQTSSMPISLHSLIQILQIKLKERASEAKKKDFALPWPHFEDADDCRNPRLRWEAGIGPRHTKCEIKSDICSERENNKISGNFWADSQSGCSSRQIWDVW